MEDLFTDLADGINLCNLLEIISGDPLGKYNKNPKIELQKLENLGKCISFLKVR